MKLFSQDEMLAATRLTQAGRLTEATAALQRMLNGQGAAATDVGSGSVNPGHRLGLPGPQQAFGESRFIARTFSNHAGTRPYKLYIPEGGHKQARSLIVMLHGCMQSPDDFATGTQMNVAAEAHGSLVAYPAQTRQANAQKCWNWFNQGDQQRDFGEPALIAGITQQVMEDFSIDPGQVFVAGLSAGGAAAAIMGNAYPDLYAAVGVHSGLACGAARDMQSAFAVMQSGAGGVRGSSSGTVIPTIVFHGERDTTVNPRNGEAVVAQAVSGTTRTRVELGRVPGGHAYKRTLYFDCDGKIVVENWVVQGGGHAWFGGSSAGSYTDSRGPDATKEMMRFFLEHSR